MGSQLGVAVAATVMLGAFELLREFDQYRMLVFGAAMVAVMICQTGRAGSFLPAVPVFLRRRKDVPPELVAEARTESPA